MKNGMNETYIFSWSGTNVKMNIEFFSLDLDKYDPRKHSF